MVSSHDEDENDSDALGIAEQFDSEGACILTSTGIVALRS